MLLAVSAVNLQCLVTSFLKVYESKKFGVNEEKNICGLFSQEFFLYRSLDRQGGMKHNNLFGFQLFLYIGITSLYFQEFGTKPVLETD